MAEDVNQYRRRFLSTAAVTVAAVQLGTIGSTKARSG